MAAPERHDEKGYEMVSTAKGNSTGLSNSAPPSAPPSAVTSAQNSSSSFFGNDTGAALPQYQTDASPLPRKGFFGRLVDPHLHDLRSDPTVLVTSKVVTSKTLFRWRCFAAFWIFFIVCVNVMLYMNSKSFG
ncbi:hypothetical protein DFS34DRAFT_595076 [Phlyctochytrium arcticum]|nr:hypothetical protein DFS34DRAFT_595076 [Phlyctochytrium arcticum]